jgi:hypothetical protein
MVKEAIFLISFDLNRYIAMVVPPAYAGGSDKPWQSFL